MPQQEIFIVLFGACWETDLFSTKSSIRTCSHYRKAFFSFVYFPSVIAKISLDTSLGVKSCLSAREKKNLTKMSTLIFIYIIAMFPCLHSFNKFIGYLFYPTLPYAVRHFWFPFLQIRNWKSKNITKLPIPDHRQPRIQIWVFFFLIQFNNLCLLISCLVRLCLM